MQLRAAVLFIEQKLTTLDARIDLNMVQTDRKTNDMDQFTAAVVTTSNATTSDAATSQTVLSVGNAQSQRSVTCLYKLSRGMQHLQTLWREWHSGLADGLFVVLFSRENPNWWKGEKTFYHRRNRIINKIKPYVEKKGISLQTALQQAQLRQTTQTTKLDAMTKDLDLIFGS